MTKDSCLADSGWTADRWAMRHRWATPRSPVRTARNSVVEWPLVPEELTRKPREEEKPRLRKPPPQFSARFAEHALARQYSTPGTSTAQCAIKGDDPL